MGRALISITSETEMFSIFKHKKGFIIEVSELPDLSPTDNFHYEDDSLSSCVFFICNLI